MVYNRFGQLIFQTTDWLQGWDGNFKSIQQPQGTYVWFLRYTNRDTKEVTEQKGTVVLIR
jgi:gliding motility-associated-like protein